MHPCHRVATLSGAESRSQPHHEVDWSDRSPVAIEGAIYSVEGRPLYGAQLAVGGMDSEERRGLLADSTGRFHVSGLPPGRYRLEARTVGFLGQLHELELLGGATDTLCLILRAEPVLPAELAPASGRW